MLQSLLIVWFITFITPQNNAEPGAWIANGWTEKEIATIYLDDYFSTKLVVNRLYSNLSVNLLPDANSQWSVIASDGRRIVIIQDSADTRKVDIETVGGFFLLQNPSEEFVLFHSYDNETPTFTRYNLETGDSFTLDLRESIPGNLYGYPHYLMGSDGTTFFTDMAGNIGSYANTNANDLTEINVSGGQELSLVLGNALSADGNLYVTCFADETRIPNLTGYNTVDGVLWKVATPGTHYENPCISKNGNIITFIQPSNGIVIIDGRTGETLSSILSDELVGTQALSPNGEYVAASLSYPETRNTFTHTCIRTENSFAEGSFDFSNSQVIQGAGFITAATNDGAYMLQTITRDEMQYSLFTKEGQILWESPVYQSNGGLQMARHMYYLTIASTHSAVACTENGYLIGYISPDDSSVTILEIVTQ